MKPDKEISKYLISLLYAFFITACGTQVDVGKNGKHGDGPVLPGGSGDGTPANGDDGTNGGSGFGLTCFGKVEELPDFLSEFCSNVDEVAATTHAKAINHICQDHYFANLFVNGCGWTGEKAQNLYFRVIEHTPLADEDPDFSFYAAFSVTVPLSKKDAMDLLIAAVSDPHYGDKYYTMPNTAISDVTVDPAKQWLTYHVENWNSSSVAKFDGRMEFVDFPSGLTAVYDRAVGNMTIIKKSRFLAFMYPIDENNTRTVYIDEKILHDGGLHDIAIRAVVKADMDRMFNNLHNSSIAAGLEEKQ